MSKLGYIDRPNTWFDACTFDNKTKAVFILILPVNPVLNGVYLHIKGMGRGDLLLYILSACQISLGKKGYS